MNLLFSSLLILQQITFFVTIATITPLFSCSFQNCLLFIQPFCIFLHSLYFQELIKVPSQTSVQVHLIFPRNSNPHQAIQPSCSSLHSKDCIEDKGAHLSATNLFLLSISRCSTAFSLVNVPCRRLATVDLSTAHGAYLWP